MTTPTAVAAGSRRRIVSVRTKLAFASGSIEEAMVAAAGIATMVYYNQVLGVSPALCGTAFLISAIADAISDPLVGALSDQVRTRWGRRHPLMLLSALPIALCFYFIYQPPTALGETGLFLWPSGGLVAMGVAKDFYAIPHTAMGAELTDDYHDRTSIFGWNHIVTTVSGIVLGVGMLVLIFPSTPEFDNGLLNRERYEVLAIVGAIICFVSVVYCTLATADQIPWLHQHDEAASGTPRSVGDAMREVWLNMWVLVRNRSYLSICFCWLVLAISGGILGVVATYGMLYAFEFNTEVMAIQRFVTVPGILLCVPVAAWLVLRLDKKLTVTWTIVASCLLAGAPFTLKWLDLFPANGTELSIIAFFGIRAIASVPLAVVPIVINSQMVDVADEHELQTGNRAEGLIFSVRLFAVKASNGLGAMLAGFGLEYIDFPQNARIETLDPAVIDNLMFMMGPLYYLIVFSGLGFVLMYRLNKSRHEEILRELEVRRRSAQAPSSPATP